MQRIHNCPQENFQSLPLSILPSVKPELITEIDQQTWRTQSTNTGTLARTNGNVSPRLVFATLRILLEQICVDERCAKRLYIGLQKRLNKFFESGSTPNYGFNETLTVELNRAISEIARRENIDIRSFRYQTNPSLVIQNQGDQPKRMKAHNFLQNYIELGELGKGGFGRVYRVRNKLDLREYALKEIPLRAGHKRTEMYENEKISREVVNLAQLDSPNIVRYFYAWLEFNPVWDFSRTTQRLASIEWPELDDSCSPTSSGSPLPCINQPMHPPSLTIEEMSPRSDCTQPFDFDEDRLPKTRELDSKDFRRADKAMWSSNWSSDEEEEMSSNCMPMTASSLAIPAAPNRSNSDPVRGSPSDRIITIRHSSTMYVGEAGDELTIPTEENSCQTQVEQQKIFKPFLYIQMELCDQSLKDWLAERNSGAEKDDDSYARVNRRLCLNIFEQMTRGVKYIHSQNMIHRDIKPANVLIVKKRDDSLLIKLADFGLSTLVRDCNCDNGMTGEAHSLSTDIGTRHYAAPEQRAGKNYDKKADMYSLGLILFELFQPYATTMELMLLTEGLRKDPVAIDRQFDGRWGDVADCVRHLVDRNPESRPSAEFLLNNSPLLTTWRFLKTENENLRKRVEFLEAENKRLREQLEIA